MSEESLPDGLLEAFWGYENALMANDLAALDAFFAPGPQTIRGDAGGILLGHEAISAFRRGRGGAPARSIGEVHVRRIGDDTAVVIAQTIPSTGGRGQQTQIWCRTTDGSWVVEAAHVSQPAPAITSSIWRVVGSPLVAGATSGPLLGLTVAVKDLFAVAGFATGAGVPAFLASRAPAEASAAVVADLLAAGASVQGIAQTDEFAYSIAGRNAHYGTPPNGAVPGAIPGGSSSGPASAVALGQASIGLGTDTGGSIRVPASYQGLWGLRTTHGSVSRTGMLPLAPSFDTVGWLTRDAATLELAATVALDATAQRPLSPSYVVDPSVVALATPEVQAAFAAAISGLSVTPVELGDPDELVEAFRVTQASEAWMSDGAWVEAHPDSLGPDIAARFAVAKGITEGQALAGASAFDSARAHLDRVLGDRILLLPSASSAAPSTTAAGEELEAIRASTLRLTCIAGLTGRPALSVPLMSVPAETTAAAPVGLGLVGPRYSDLALIALGISLVE